LSGVAPPLALVNIYCLALSPGRRVASGASNPKEPLASRKLWLNPGRAAL
jgi:hypothetical protein